MLDNSNYFKARLKTTQQIGMWLALANSYSAEIAATVGFDWLLIDAEHAPNDLRSVLQQLQVIAAYPSQAVVRPVSADVEVVKQLLDIGAQSLLIPMIETAQQAELMVKATRYPPEGIRGVGAALARASRWNSLPSYLHDADQQICLLLQVESKQGVAHLDEILAVEGVDGIFIGPADLSADMGHRGNPAHPDVQQVIESSIEKIRAAGKAAGILAVDSAYIDKYLALAVDFIAIGIDTRILMQSMQQLFDTYQAKNNQ